MKTKKKTLVALLATFAVGAAAVTGLAFGASNAFVNGRLIANADTVVEEDETYTDLHIGSNSLTLIANEVQTCIINGEEGEHAPGGYYTIKRESGNAKFTLNVEGEELTVVLNAFRPEFTALILSPSLTPIQVEWTSDQTFNFAISYSETNPDASDEAVLKVGDNTVNATGFGADYVFTSTTGGSYSLSCHDVNAFIMVETVYTDPDYGDISEYEEVPLFDAEYNQYGEVVEILEWLTYDFTVEAGTTVNFLMSTLDWSDAQYTVTIAQN